MCKAEEKSAGVNVTIKCNMSAWGSLKLGSCLGVGVMGCIIAGHLGNRLWDFLPAVLG